MKKGILLLLLVVFTNGAFSQSSKTETVKIQTSAECQNCKDLLENKLNYTPGIKYAVLKMENKVLEVKYNLKKISKDEIRVLISQLGYDADDIKAVESAVKKLPLCCQPGGHKN